MARLVNLLITLFIILSLGSLGTILTGLDVFELFDEHVKPIAYPPDLGTTTQEHEEFVKSISEPRAD